MNKYQQAFYFLMTHMQIKDSEDYEQISNAWKTIAELIEKECEKECENNE